jgi:hypothetical protein
MEYYSLDLIGLQLRQMGVDVQAPAGWGNQADLCEISLGICAPASQYEQLINGFLLVGNIAGELYEFPVHQQCLLMIGESEQKLRARRLRSQRILPSLWIEDHGCCG